MELILERIAKRKTYTIGRLYEAPPRPLPSREGSNYSQGQTTAAEVSTPLPAREGSGEGLLYFCDTLEPTWRDYAHGAYKVKGRSAIPEGRYAVVISWSPKFRQWLPILLGGPEFNKQWQGIVDEIVHMTVFRYDLLGKPLQHLLVRHVANKVISSLLVDDEDVGTCLLNSSEIQRPMP
jgi:hypothetical protein